MTVSPQKTSRIGLRCWFWAVVDAEDCVCWFASLPAARLLVWLTYHAKSVAATEYCCTTLSWKAVAGQWQIKFRLSVGRFTLPD